MRKSFKTVAAIALSATMAIASYVPAFADTAQSGTGTGAVYAYAYEEYLVPTTLAFALNPQELNVLTAADAEAPVTDQVISLPVGIVNRSTRAKAVTIDLEVSTVGSGDTDITFVDSADAVDGDSDDFNLYLAVTPAAGDVTKLADDSDIDTETAAADLANVIMTKATGHDVALATGSNEIAFKLDEAAYKFDDDKSIVLGTDTANDVSDKFVIDTLGGVTAFMLTGSMNEDAYWENNEKQVKIDLTYDIREVTDDDEVIDGTGAMISVGPKAIAATPANMSTTVKSATISNVPEGATLSTVKVIKLDDSEVTLAATTQYTYTNNVFAIVTGKEVLLDNTKYKKFVLTYSDDSVINIPIVAAD